MSQTFALLSIVFMMGFVMTFDRIHWRSGYLRRLLSLELFSPQEVDQVRLIWSACQDS